MTIKTPPITANPQLTLDLSLPEQFSFQNFVIGENHETIYTLERLLSVQAESTYLFGGRGVGKTHLLHALCALAEQNGLTSIYLPGKDLLNFQPGVLEGIADIDLVCLDDIDVFAGHLEWETAIMALFNLLRAGGKRLVVVARERANFLGMTLPDLVSRLTWGYVFQIKPLSDDNFARALTIHAKEKGIQLANDVALYLSRRCPRQMHKALKIIDILDKTSLSQKKKVTIPFIKQVLGW